MNRRRLWLIGGLLAALVVAVALSGCGGSDDNTGGGTGISGRVVDVTSNLGIGNVVVTAGGKSATSSSTDGSFLIRGLTAGTYALTVTPSAIFVPVPGPVPHVTVVKDAVTNVGEVLIIDPSLVPPGS